MKKNNKKGFTLVELVIVIAVVAILAGVLIATFASVIKRANNSAKVQEIKAEEIAQKADDIISKIENSNWFGWEDFENSIVEKLTALYTSEKTTLSLDDIKTVVDQSFVTYLANQQTNNTGLTEDQVKAIVENALGTLKYEGVTEAQVKAIVLAATNQISVNQLTAAQVRSIVTSANDKNLTAAEVAQVIANAGLVSLSDATDMTNQILNKLNTATSVLATKEDVESIKEYIQKLEASNAMQEQAVLELVKSVNDPNYTGTLTVNVKQDIILSANTDTGEATGSITLNNENAVLNLNLSDKTVSILEAQAVAWNGGRILQNDAGELNIVGGTFNADERSWGFIRTYGGITTITNTTATNCRTDGLSVKVCSGEVYLKDVTVTSTYGGCVCTDTLANDDPGYGKLVIDGGTYSQSGLTWSGPYQFVQGACALGASGGGTVVVNDGIFSSNNGYSAVCTWSTPTNVTINGGTFTGTGTRDKSQTDTTQVATKCVVIMGVNETDYSKYNNMGTTFTINDGTFVGDFEVASSHVDFVINGGTFTVSEGNVSVIQSHVVSGHTVTINGTSYTAE